MVCKVNKDLGTEKELHYNFRRDSAYSQTYSIGQQ